MARITIGQYYPTGSIIHRLDPRVKIIGSIMHIATLLMASTFWAYLAAAIYTATIIAISKVPPKMMIRGLRAILFMLLFAVTINIFLMPGETVLFSLGFIQITQEAIFTALQMAARLVLLIMGTSLLTLATSPIRLTDGIEALLKPLAMIKIPAHDIAMMMTIALRFIPTLADEMGKIIKAQKARGADFDTGSLLKRAKSLLPILVPLFISAFKRADELATAMEARCYRGGIGRTKMKPMQFAPRDIIALLLILAISAVIIYV